jgi:hypothetical protein
MSKTIKLKQSDIEKIVSGIVSEQMDPLGSLEEIDNESDDIMEPGPGKVPIHLGLTPEGGYVLYKTNANGEDEVIRKFDK